MGYKEIIGIVPTLQSAALLGANVKALKSRKQKPLKMAVGNLVGIELIKSTAQSAGSL